jgi:hypothetical protein
MEVESVQGDSKRGDFTVGAAPQAQFQEPLTSFSHRGASLDVQLPNVTFANEQ